MSDTEWIDRPNIPPASGFRIAICGDPKCGPHIVVDVGGKPYCELVLHQQTALAMIAELQEALGIDKPQRGH